MRGLHSIAPEEREHYEWCPACNAYFDMRDLRQVALHLHFAATPEIHFSGSQKVGKDGEVYVPTDNGIKTLQLKQSKTTRSDHQ